MIGVLQITVVNIGRSVRRRLINSQQATAHRELVISISIGKESVVSNPDEATRQDVHQKPTEKLRTIKLHHLLLILVGIIFVVKGDAVAFNSDQSLI